MKQLSARRKWYQLTLIESLVIVAIITALITLLIPPTQWASSGEIEAPVRILVFDARSAKPIPQAKCAVLRGPPWYDNEFLTGFQERIRGIEAEMRTNHAPVAYMNEAMTSDDGTAVINFKVRTGANHERPEPYAHTNFVWVFVLAEGYGGVAVPLRHESMSTKRVRELTELRVPVGLFPAE